VAEIATPNAAESVTVMQLDAALKKNEVLSTQLSERDAEIARLLALRQEREASLESVKKLEQQLREASQTALELKESQIVNLKTELQRAESAVDEHNKKHHAREAELDRLRSDLQQKEQKLQEGVTVVKKVTDEWENEVKLREKEKHASATKISELKAALDEAVADAVNAQRLSKELKTKSDELAGLRKQLAPTEPPLERNVSSSSDESATEAEAEPLSNADTESGVAEVEPTAPPTKTSSRRSSKRGASTEAPSEDAENPACGFAGKGSTGEVSRRPLAALDTNADAARYALRNRGEKTLKRTAIENEEDGNRSKRRVSRVL